MSIRSPINEELQAFELAPEFQIKTTVHNYENKMKAHLQLKRDMIFDKIRSNPNSETTLDYYQIIRLLGEGSYAKVYLAKSVLCELPVAIKCFEKLKLKTEDNFSKLE